MAFVDTQPAVINRGDAAEEWLRFRVRSPRKLLEALREICRTDTPVTVGVPGGVMKVLALWAVDEVSRRLHFKLDGELQEIEALGHELEVWAAAYVADAKVQFLLGRMTITQVRGHQVLESDITDVMYHLPRRQAVRVRRSDDEEPKARFVHPLQPQSPTTLRVLDVSSTGCALLRPADGLVLPLGMVLQQVEVELDESTIIFCDLVVHQASTHNQRDRNMRVGCGWHRMAPVARERLEAWIASGRRRRVLLSLNLLD